MTANKFVTIMDVAREAKVAPSTVSLVSNGSGYVSDKTRKRVEQVIRKSGYKPRGRRKTTGAPASRSRLLDLVVLYVHATPNPVPMSANTLGYIEGMNEAFNARQIRPSLIAAADRVEDDPVLLSNLRARKLDGAILIGLGDDQRGYVHHLTEADVPVVLVSHRTPHSNLSSVGPDFFHGSWQATRHLIELGHRKIGFTGWTATHWATAERFRGYEAALKEAGLEPAEPLLFRRHALDKRQQVIAEFCRDRIDEGYTAFVMGDHQAQASVPAIEAAGRAVPGDVSIVGFDGLGLRVGSEKLKLTSISYDRHHVGQIAVQTLLEIIEGRGQFRCIEKTVTTRLVEGATTAPPPEAV